MMVVVVSWMVLLLVSLYVHDCYGIKTSFRLSTLKDVNMSGDTAYGGICGLYNHTLFAIKNKTSITLDISNIDSNTLINNNSISFTRTPSWRTKILNSNGGWSDDSYNRAVSSVSIGNLIYTLFEGTPPPNSALIFDMKTNEWSQNSPLQFSNDVTYDPARYGCHIARDEYIYVIGGLSAVQLPAIPQTNHLLRFNAKNYTITALQNMTTKRRSVACVLYHDQLYAMGGYGPNEKTTDIIEVYSIANDTWFLHGVTLKNRRTSSFSWLHPNNKWIIIVGGRCPDRNNYICPNEYFEPDTGVIIQDNDIRYNSYYFCHAVWEFSVNMSIVFLYGGQTAKYLKPNNSIRHDVKYMILNVDDYIQGLSPTQQPTINPSKYPTLRPTSYPTRNIDFEVIGLFLTCIWNVSDDNNTLYDFVMENSTTFTQLLTENILNHYSDQIIDKNEIILKLVDLYENQLRNWMNISYNVTNFNQGITNLEEYFVSKQFADSLTNNVNAYYYHNSSSNRITDTKSKAEQYKSFLPPPPLDVVILLKLNNPLSVSCFCLAMILCITLLLAFMHGRKPLVFNNVCKLSITDDFKLNRAVSFLFNTLMFINTLNTTYGYIYFYTYYNYHSQLLCIGLLCFLIIIANISLNLHYFMNHFTKHLKDINADYTVLLWNNDNRKYLGLFSIISLSLYGAISFANCHLFGLQLFTMGLSDVQLKRFISIHQKKLLCLAVVKLLVHCYAVYYLFVIKYDGIETIQQFTILSIIFSVVNLLSKLSTFSKTNNSYGTRRFEIKIKCEGDDIRKIQHRKGLVKQILQYTALYLEVHASQIEIIHVKSHKQGICLRFMYNSIINTQDASDDIKDDGDTEASYMERLLTCSDDINSIVLSLQQLEQDKEYKMHIQSCYELESVPLKVYCNVIHDFS